MQVRSLRSGKSPTDHEATWHARPLATADDLLFLAMVPFLGAVSWLLPPSAWPCVCAPVGLMFAALRPARRRETDARVRAMLGHRAPEVSAANIEADIMAGTLESRLVMLREFRPRPTQSRLALLGREHLDHALDRRRGAILWIAPHVLCDLLAKRALTEAGYPVGHLSRPEHGFSTSRLARKLLNPLHTSRELRYLDERVVMNDDSPLAALRRLKGRLARNGIVSITVGNQGRGCIRAPFLDGEIEVANGAIKLAAQTGAALLPVSSLRVAPGRVEIRIAPPLNPADADPAALTQDALAATYARRIEDEVLSHPGQWRGWRTLVRPSVRAAVDDGTPEPT